MSQITAETGESTEAPTEVAAASESYQAERAQNKADVLAGDWGELPDEGDAPAEIQEPTEEPEGVEDAPEEPEGLEAAEEAAEEPEEAAPVAAEDDELSKRLEALQKEERRGKEAVGQERAAFNQERQAFQKEREQWQSELSAFQEAQRRAKVDPAGFVMAHGIETPEELMYAAQQLHAMAKGADADPAQKASARRQMLDREQASEVQQTRKELTELKAEIQAEKEQRAQQREVETYLGTVEKAATEETPLVSNMLKNDPEDAKQQLLEVARYILQQTDETPEPADVVKALEQGQRRKLQKLGIDPDLVIKATPKNKPEVAEEKKTAKSLSNDLGNSTKPRAAPQSRGDLRADVLRDMERGLESL